MKALQQRCRCFVVPVFQSKWEGQMNALASIKAKIEKTESGWRVTVPTLVRTSPILGIANVLLSKEAVVPNNSEALRLYRWWYDQVIIGGQCDMSYQDGFIVMDCR